MNGGHAKFVQITASGEDDLYALDEWGQVWWLNDTGDKPHWLKLTTKRIAKTEEVK